MKSIIKVLLVMAICGSTILELGCSAPGIIGKPGENYLLTPLGKVLDRIWNAHAGVKTWQGWESVRFRMNVHGSSALQLPSEEVKYKLVDRNFLMVGSKGNEELYDLTEVANSGSLDLAMDYHLRTARVFFQLPMTLSQNGWEIRQDVFSGDGGSYDPIGFWAVPIQFPCPHVGYFVIPDKETGLLKSVYYQVKHPYFEGKIFAAEFRNYVRVDGILLATEITHRLVKNPPRSMEEGAQRSDPFEPARATFDPAKMESSDMNSFSSALFWTMRFDDIQFEAASTP